VAKRERQDQMTKSVLVIGGLGFVGYHIIRELESKNYRVSVGSRSRETKTQSGVPILFVDLKNMSDEELNQLFSDFNYIIFAGGADDRTMPKGDAAEFFYNENVVPCVRIANICSELATEKLVILGSYFTYFDRTIPLWKMSDRHPYVRSRKLQQEETEKAAKGNLQVITLELPYIFGSEPEKIPLWKPLVNYVRLFSIVFYTHGGTNVVSVEMVAKAVLGSLENQIPGNRWVVGGQNVSWKEMITLMADALGKKRRVVSVPNWLVRSFASLVWVYFKIARKQSGLNIFHFIETQTSQTYLETEESKKVLNYAESNIPKAMKDTVDACGYTSR
jgi:dihydroflavonol-4-reductase